MQSMMLLSLGVLSRCTIEVSVLRDAAFISYTKKKKKNTLLKAVHKSAMHIYFQEYNNWKHTLPNVLNQKLGKNIIPLAACLLSVTHPPIPLLTHCRGYCLPILAMHWNKLRKKK